MRRDPSRHDVVVVGARAAGAATAMLLARAVVAAVSGDVSEADAFAEYQDTRDRLSLPLFVLTDAVASQRWTDTEIGALLLQLSAAMAVEVDALAALGARDAIAVR